MSAFTNRNTGYKMGVCLLFFAPFLFLVGFGSPYWFTAESDVGFGISVKSSTGLWMACVSAASQSQCVSLGLTDQTESWFVAVRALTCICLILLSGSCLYALATNCCRSFTGPRTRILEISALAGGLFGFVGSMVFAGYIEDGPGLDWSFYLSAVGSALCVVAAVVIAIFNKPIDTPAAIGGTTVAMTTLQPHMQGQPQPYMQGQPQSYMQGQPQSYMQGQPQPYMQGQAQPYVIQGQPQQYASYPASK